MPNQKIVAFINAKILVKIHLIFLVNYVACKTSSKIILVPFIVSIISKIYLKLINSQITCKTAFHSNRS